MGVIKYITGQKFNRLTAIEFSHIGKNGTAYWKFKCDCGNEINRKRYPVEVGDIKSCGCLRNESKKGIQTSVLRRFYRIWIGMKTRCYGKYFIKYYNYGGRGIKVCDEWLNFSGFRKDMEKGYWEHVNEFGEKQTTLDRINVNGNYCKENCRWADYKLQRRNTRPYKYSVKNKGHHRGYGNLIN